MNIEPASFTYGERLVRKAKDAGLRNEQIIRYLQDEYDQAMNLIRLLLENDIKLQLAQEEFVEKLKKLAGEK